MATRPTTIVKPGYIPVIKQMDRGSWKVIITDASSVQYDVTDYLISGTIDRVSTVGVSSFKIELDNSVGLYKDKFATRNTVDFYYDFKDKSALSVVRFRGIIDNVFNNFDESSGFTLSIEGRDAPISSTNEHFVDTLITIQFTGRNNLDCLFGASTTADSNGNKSDGVLYNSGMIFKVYDSSTSTWKNYKDLTESEMNSIKSIYTQTNSNTYGDKSRLSVASQLAIEGDFDFRIFYDSSDGNTYFMVHKEDAITNPNESVTAGQNLISISRLGVENTNEYNRVKSIGQTDGTLLVMRTKADTTRHSVTWIKDYIEPSSSITSDTELSARATARLTELKTQIKKGSISSCVLPSLQPGEKIMVNIPYIVTEPLKVKSYSITLGADFSMGLEIQDKETTFEKLFKDRIDENANVLPLDNPNGMTNGIVYDFSTETDYTLADVQIIDKTLSLVDGKTTGVCICPTHTADNNITQFELRIKGNQTWNCTYRVSNDNGLTYSDVYTLGSILYFTTTGKYLKLEITLNESTSGVSPQFEKVDLLYK